MIRRFYIMPLNPLVDEAKVAELLDGLEACDRFIPGLIDSSAGIDRNSRTVVWENNFVDEASYAGPYMVHPYHAQTLDNYLMGDSPECITHDIFTVRCQLPDGPPPVDRGIRRILMMKLADGADTALLESLADGPSGMASSTFRPDDVGWVSAKGRAWTHIWDQAFADEAALQAHLATREGVAASSLEGLKRLGIDIQALRILTFPFAIKPRQTPPDPTDDKPLHYTITARMAPGDVDRFLELLTRDYDAFMAQEGVPLVTRLRSADGVAGEAEILSTWRMESFAAYDKWRARTYADKQWNRFVSEAMPLVTGGTRRFHYAV